MGGACSEYGREERLIRGFGEKPEGKIPLGRTTHSWKDNIKIDLQKHGIWGYGLDRAG